MGKIKCSIWAVKKDGVKKKIVAKRFAPANSLNKGVLRIVEVLWNDHVDKHFPTNADNYKESLIMFAFRWHFPFCFGAVDGYYILTKYFTGGLEANKEYHNFKKILFHCLMIMVDVQYRFMWASCCYLDNSHDAVIFQGVNFYQEIIENSIKPLTDQNEKGVEVQLFVIRDSAF